jgi:hypothetical protein
MAGNPLGAEEFPGDIYCAGITVPIDQAVFQHQINANSEMAVVKPANSETTDHTDGTDTEEVF